MGGCRGEPGYLVGDGLAIDTDSFRPSRGRSEIRPCSRRPRRLSGVRLGFVSALVRPRRVCSACPNLYRSVNTLATRHCSGALSGLAPALDTVAVGCSTGSSKIAIHCSCLRYRVARDDQRARIQRPTPPYRNRHGDHHRQMRAPSSTRCQLGCPSLTRTTARSSRGAQFSYGSVPSS